MLWAQSELQKSVGSAEQHAIVVSIVKNHCQCHLKEDIVAIMEENRGKISLVQKNCTDKAAESQS